VVGEGGARPCLVLSLPLSGSNLGGWVCIHTWYLVKRVLQTPVSSIMATRNGMMARAGMMEGGAMVLPPSLVSLSLEIGMSDAMSECRCICARLGSQLTRQAREWMGDGLSNHRWLVAGAEGREEKEEEEVGDGRRERRRAGGRWSGWVTGP